ncbi:hypothetical protein BBJ28_00014421 [Nothophytophthora sp. Chile5]|nr:hypothetical protein BBJ28_00014421 [Nothophytophthora sp. Chile5]
MKTATFSVLAVLGAVAVTVYAVEPCNDSDIEGKLLPNGTEFRANCLSATGVDVFALDEFPTKDQAQLLSETRDCVNYLNQINQVANQEIQCETQVGDQTVIFRDLITDFLTGETGNKTEVASESGSGSDVEFPGSESDSGSAGSPKKKKKVASSSDSGSGSEEAGFDNNSTSTSGAATTSLSIVAAAGTTLLAFML